MSRGFYCVCFCAILNVSTVERAVESCPRKGGDWYGNLRILYISRCVHRADHVGETIKEKTRLMHPNCRRGSLPNIRGSRLSAVPFCISILTSVRRIVKIAVRFLHTKTALCDRKDTQSRFAVNAARSIVCVETTNMIQFVRILSMFQCRRQHCVCRDSGRSYANRNVSIVSMPHAALCVSRQRTVVCESECEYCFNAARSIVCVETTFGDGTSFTALGFNAARSIVCVETKE